METKIEATCDGKTINFETKSNNVHDSLFGTPCEMKGNDGSEPVPDTKLNGGELSIQVFRAVNIEILDNGKSTFYKSGYSQISSILEQLEIKLDSQDKVRKELILEGFSKPGLGQRIIIDRAPIINVQADGTAHVFHSWKKTAGEILQEAKFPLGAKDEVVPGRESLVLNGETIVVTRVNEAEVIEEETIDFEIITQKDYDLHQGKSFVEQEGTAGLKEKTFKVIYKNGIETDRILLDSQLVRAVVNKVIRIGVKPYSHEDLWNIMVTAGAQYGVSPEEMFSVMMCESGGNNHANTFYKGIFQWDGSFYDWAAKAGFPNADILNVEAQIYATALRVSQNGWGAWGCKP